MRLCKFTFTILSYLVCILFGMPSLHPFFIFNVVFFVYTVLCTRVFSLASLTSIWSKSICLYGHGKKHSYIWNRLQLCWNLYVPQIIVHWGTHLSLCVMAAFLSRPCIVVKRPSSRVCCRYSNPCCTWRLPPNRMAFKNANTSRTISSFGCDKKGITWKRSVTYVSSKDIR